MKKILSLLVITLILALTFTSCSFVKKTFYKYDVVFDLNGGVAGEGFVEAAEVKHGKTVSMSTPTMENFTFVGWFDGDEQYTESTPIEKDVTLVAKWEFNNTYTLTFDTNGMVDVPVAHPIIGELPEIPETPMVEGYVFAGWYFDAEYTTRYFFDYPLTEATTLYAKFYDLALGEYIVISNVEQLMAIKDVPDAKYLLACDINCKGEILTPIDEFTGEIDGNGYRIFNFGITDDDSNVAFIQTNKGTVKNVTFDDFTFDVLIKSGAGKNYGVICGINKGILENCHTSNGEMKLDYSAFGGLNAYVGGIVGSNDGTVSKCTNNITINVFVYADEDRGGYKFGSYIGGICGVLNLESKLIDCVNYGDIKVNCDTDGYGHNYIYLGGVVGYAIGYVDNTANLGNLNVSAINVQTTHLYIGGHTGQNYGGTIQNSFVQCDIVIENSINGQHTIDSRIGGFAGYNSGKIYNCYSVTNIKDNGTKYNAVGGFVGFNDLLSGHESLINKCFAFGSIDLGGMPINAGYFVGISTGTVKDAYYSDTLKIDQIKVTENEDGTTTESRESIDMTNDIGEAKSESVLLSLGFLENTLYFDRMVWFLSDGKLPELR